MNKQLMSQGAFEKQYKAVDKIRLALKEREMTEEEVFIKLTDKEFRFSAFRARQLINDWKDAEFESINVRHENKRSATKKIKDTGEFSIALSVEAQERFKKLHPEFMSTRKEMV